MDERDPRPCWPRLLRHEAREPIRAGPRALSCRALCGSEWTRGTSRPGAASPATRARCSARSPPRTPRTSGSRSSPAASRLGRCPRASGSCATRCPAACCSAPPPSRGRPRLDRLLGGVDVVWAPAPAPLAVSAGVPLVLTVHDRSFEERPRRLHAATSALWHRARPAARARRAAPPPSCATRTRCGRTSRGRGASTRRSSPPGRCSTGPSARGRGRRSTAARRTCCSSARSSRARRPTCSRPRYARARERGLAADLVVVGDGPDPDRRPRHPPRARARRRRRARRAVRRRGRGRRALVARGLRPAAGRGRRAGHAQRRQRPARCSPRRSATARCASRRATPRRWPGRSWPIATDDGAPRAPGRGGAAGGRALRLGAVGATRCTPSSPGPRSGDVLRRRRHPRLGAPPRDAARLDRAPPRPAAVKTLELKGKRVTGGGVAEFKKKLPQCRVKWDSPEPLAAVGGRGSRHSHTRAKVRNSFATITWTATQSWASGY